jgi:ribosomal-protein-serine acetyltransferase
VSWLPWAHPEHRRSDTRRYLRHARIARARRLTYDFAILSGEAESFVGVVGLHRLDWSRRCAGLGYWVRRASWDHGFATEAAACVVEHAFRDLGLNRIEAHVATDNQRSQRVAEKLGFHREGVAREVERVAGRYVDHIQYSLLRREVLGPSDPGWEPQ